MALDPLPSDDSGFLDLTPSNSGNSGEYDQFYSEQADTDADADADAVELLSSDFVRFENDAPGPAEQTSNKPNSRWPVTWKVAVGVGAILGGAGLGAFRLGLPPFGASRSSNDEVILNYLAQPTFSGEALSHAFLGESHLELYDLNTRTVYFSIPEAGRKESEVTRELAKYVGDQNQIVWASEQNGRQVLGDLIYRTPASQTRLFSIPAKAFHVPPDTAVTVNIDSLQYSITVSELGAYLDNRCVYGGHMALVRGEAYSGVPIMLPNHGAFVAVPNEPSLTRLVHSITAHDSTREERIQSMANFVSRGIKYDYGEAAASYETLKHPSEIILTGSSDCSGKAILMASLLEQSHEDYLLVYMSHHITIAVPLGKFSHANGAAFNYQGQTWTTIEGTIPGYQIGYTVQVPAFDSTKIECTQRPREKDKIILVATGQPLKPLK